MSNQSNTSQGGFDCRFPPPASTSHWDQYLPWITYYYIMILFMINSHRGEMVFNPWSLSLQTLPESTDVQISNLVRLNHVRVRSSLKFYILFVCFMNTVIISHHGKCVEPVDSSWSHSTYKNDLRHVWIKKKCWDGHLVIIP